MPPQLRPGLRSLALALTAAVLACASLAGPSPAQTGPAAGAAAGAAGGQKAARPVQAGYIRVAASEVPVQMTLTGRAVAQNATQLRPRVGGAVTAILYTPGTPVAAGTALFSIDPLAYQVALTAAEAEQARASADLKAAESTFARVERLQGSASSRAAYDDAEVALMKARATLAESTANLDLARAQLDWTTVRAPLTGIIGVPQVAIGDLVTANQSGALAEIVQIDPIHVDLSEPYPARLRLEAQAARGEITLTEPHLQIVLDDGRRPEAAARLVSTGTTVSASTGTRQMRFEVANPGGLIAPGMFVQGSLTLGRQNAILVPQRAAQRERDGSLTAWVAEDGKARKRRLTENGSYGNAWVVLAGLAPGDWLLIDGLSNLRDGQEVTPVEAEIDENGVVRDAASGSGSGSGAGN